MIDMKIAILTPTFSHFSGIDRLVELKSREFIGQGQEVDIFALKGTLKPKKANLFLMGCPSYPFLERIYRLFMFLDFRKIKHYVQILQDYDLIISHLYPMNILASKAKKKNKNIKYIYHNAGVGIVESYSILEKLYLHIFNYFTNNSIKNADKVISISNFLRKELKRETGIDSEVEYIPIDKKRFHKGIRGEMIRKRYNIKDQPILLYIGRVSPHKGIHILIRAFQKVKEKFPDSKLIIVGKKTFGNYIKKLKKMSNTDIIFTGFVNDNDLPNFYAACDVYTTASLWEGFDLPLAEANAMAKPAVAFDIGAHKEVMKKGRLVKKGDIGEFAKAVITFIEKKNLKA
ncbi:glycosyltransferase [Candidatus Woesearchaeota archaeon]|nr:glycosyltransferase [Candidatus Woesearchaeota archaeon]